MIKRYLLFCSLFTVIASAQTAADYGIHPIDAKRLECRGAKENQDPDGSIGCEYTARIAWEKEVERYSDLLLKVLKPGEKKIFKTAQKDWVVFRDNEMEFANNLYKHMESKAWLVVHAVRLTNIFRTRALELQEYHEMATFDPE